MVNVQVAGQAQEYDLAQFGSSAKIRSKDQSNVQNPQKRSQRLRLWLQCPSGPSSPLLYRRLTRSVVTIVLSSHLSFNIRYDG